MATLESDRSDVDRAAVQRMVSVVEPSWSVETVRPTEEGSSGVFFVTVATPDGTREVVLKAFDGGVVSDTVAAAEPRLLELLRAETAVPVPGIVGFVDEHPDLPAPFFLAERLPGENGSGRFDDLSPAARERVFAAAGTHLAALHDLRSFDRFGRVGVDDDGLAVVDDGFDRRERWADWLLADVEDTLDGLAGGRFDDLVPALRDHLREAVPRVQGPDEARLVHWDYRLGNLLLDPETGATTGVLDWAGLVAGDPVYNLVAVEDHNLNWQTQDPERRRRLRAVLYEAYEDRREGALPADLHERKRLYHLCHRLNAMACLPDWYADADPAVRDERAAVHRAFVRDHLE